ncbi:MAG: hypothetical protein QOE62_1725 [Actinomycetota bacterium]|nr:hypothetical protein [Actinomycetota bacterium]
MGVGPVVIGYDGSRTAQRAIEEGGALLASHEALIVTVYEPGVAFDLIDLPTMPPAPLDVRAAIEIDRALYDAARQVARQGAQLAEKAGLVAEPLVVADQLTVAESLLRVVKDRDAQAVIVGTQRRLGLRDIILGSTARGVIRSARCPVVVVRADEKAKDAR